MAEIETFLAELASASPVPGGGSVAAFEVTMGAALLAMVASLTIGRKRYTDVEQQATEIRAEAEQLQARARALIDEDAASYSAVSAAMGLPRETDDQKARRSGAIQRALQGAVQPPLETMRVAARVAALASELVAIGNRSAASDVGTAALSALAGFEAARLNVEINLAAIKDEGWVAGVRADLERIGGIEEEVRRTVATVESLTRGQG
jgi:formiminotetrahydrofolate cyclodeaminase